MSLVRIKESPRRSRAWRRRILWVVLIFGGLLLALYLVASSSAFFQAVVLPQVSKALNADVTVADAEIRPLRRVVLRDIKVHPRGAEPLLSVKEVRVRYNLLSLICGRITLAELTVDSPVVTLVRNPDGSSNLDPLPKDPSVPDDDVQTTEKPADINIGLLALQNATVRVVQKHEQREPDVSELTGLNFVVRDLRNGETGRMEVGAVLALQRPAVGDMPASFLRGKLEGGLVFELSPELLPSSVKGDVDFQIEETSGAFADLNQARARFVCETTPTEIKEVAVHFAKGTNALGYVRASGAYRIAANEGDIKVEVRELDREVLNLIGAPHGLDFGPTTINAVTDLKFTRGGEEIDVAGEVAVADLELVQEKRKSPRLNLRATYGATIDQAKETALITRLNFSGTQDGQTVLRSELPQPFPVSWGDANAVGSAATFNITVTNLSLAGWQTFLGDPTPGGVFDARVELSAQQNAQEIQITSRGRLAGFVLPPDGSTVGSADLQWQTRAQVKSLNEVNLENFQFEVLRTNQQALVTLAAGTLNLETGAADLQVTVRGALEKLLPLAGMPDAKLRSGELVLQSQIVGRSGVQTITGQLAITNISGAMGDAALDKFGANLAYDVALRVDAVEVRKLTGVIRHNERPGGEFSFGGNVVFGEAMPSGKLNVTLTGLNEEALRPFTASLWGEQQLISVSVNSAMSLQFQTNGDATIQSDLQITNLVVGQPNANPPSPLQARLQLNAEAAKEVAEIRMGQLNLTPTERAKNELNLMGQVNYSKPQAITGQFKVRAEALDLTRYYDLFAALPAGEKPTEAPAEPASVPPEATPEAEPEAMLLPFRGFTFNVDIGRIYLREVDIAKLQTTTTLDDATIQLKPFQMTLNDAPVRAEVLVNVNVPGYRYAISFNADSVPLTPLVNTFQPDLKDLAGGQFVAGIELEGAGLTLSNARTNLTGQFNVAATNLSLSVSSVRNPLLNLVLNTVVNLPELIATVTGKGGGNLNWAEEIRARPIDTIRLQAAAGGGRVDLQNAIVSSAAFQLQSAAGINLAPVLTNSPLELPIHIALAQPLAAKIGYANAAATTNSAYVALPDFLSIKGTLGNAQRDINWLGLAQLAGQSLGGVNEKLGDVLGEKGKSVLDAVNTILGAPGTNRSTNSPAVNTNLLPQLRSLFPRKESASPQ